MLQRFAKPLKWEVCPAAGSYSYSGGMCACTERKKHALITTNTHIHTHRELHAVAAYHARDVEPPPFSSACSFSLCVSLYLLGGERLRPVIQNEPVFAEGFGLCRRFLALLAVCDFAVFIHG